MYALLSKAEDLKLVNFVNLCFFNVKVFFQNSNSTLNECIHGDPSREHLQHLP